MQQIQRAVLNKIQPGIVPIFIISPNKNDGDVLASVMSEYIRHKKHDKADAIHLKNYFSNSDSRKLLPITVDPNDKKKEDYRSSLKLVIEQGFDNNKLWGLQLDYQLFFELEVDSLFPYATFIFLYGTKENKFGTKKIDSYLRRAYDFCKNNPRNTILLNSHNVTYAPTVILNNLPFSTDFTILDIKQPQEIQFKRENAATYISTDNYEEYGIKQELDKLNYLNNSEVWYSGSDVIAIIVFNENITEDILINRLFQLINSFTPQIEINIICRQEEELTFVQEILQSGLPLQGINCILIDIEINISEVINDIINKSTCPYIVVDNLLFSYSIINLLSPFKLFNIPSFVFSALNNTKYSHESQTKLALIDLLTIKAIPNNIAFTRSQWQNINGFDPSFPYKLAIWDFCIRALEKEDNYAFETTASTPSSANKPLADDPELSSAGYMPLIKKHKLLFDTHLSRVLVVAAENRHVPQDEIVRLNYKIATLQTFITHSKDELIAVSEQRIMLQNHINLLEGRWYFKVARNFSQFKQIFFKESSSGGKGILKMLTFLFFAFTKPGFRILRKVVKAILRKMYLIVEDRQVRILYLDESTDGNTTIPDNYNEWIRKKLNIDILRKDYENNIATLTVQPKISIIMPVYNPPIEYLSAAIESVLGQLYNNFELCIADDCSPDPMVARVLHTYSMKDPRIKVIMRTENGHISACSNSALSLATGDYVFCLDHDDLLTANCLYELVKYINENPDIEVVYSDEDKIDDNGIFSNPYFKPDWAPDNLLAKNYITHIAVYKKNLIDEVGGYRPGFDGSQDYDLVLRVTDKATKIGHIPKVLYHWRIHTLSAAMQEDVKPYAFIAAKKALEETLQRRNLPGEVQYLPGLLGYRVKYNVSSFDKVTVLIPTKDQAKLMRNTIDSLISLTEYPNYEIIVLDNNSNTPEFFELMNEYKEKYSSFFRCVEAKFPFNFSKLMNVGAALSTGDYILMLNNDVEITHSDWMTTMVSFAQQKRIGAVGVKLLYPNDNIQHAGTVVGLGGVAGHVFVHQYRDDPGYFGYLTSTTNYSAVTAACLMIRKSVYDEVQGMDEALEVEFNDVDFCLKVLDKGYYNVYVPDVILYHYESATRGHPHQNKVSFERHLREVKYFKDKWDKYIKRDPFYNPNLTLDRQDYSINYKY